MQIPDDLRYTANHEWARAEDGGLYRVGITDFAQDALGDIVFVALPDPGMVLGAGDSLGEVESTKSVSDVYAPVAGTVEAVNEALRQAPQAINDDPYGDGWIILIKADGEPPEDLMDATAYREFSEASSS
ncbi:MAG: glycine cleavage system protein GcvH [Actinomycetota bacterium]|nr:glycine cleavage system protein GcvH [Actinomycetota bacterium]